LAINSSPEMVCAKAGPPNLWKLVYHSDYISQPTVFLRRRALDEVGYLDESLHWGMDWDLFIRLGKRGRIAYIPKLLASQREYDDTKTASGGFSRFGSSSASCVGTASAEISARLRLRIDTCFNVVRRRSAFLPTDIPRVAQAGLPLWKWIVPHFARWEGWYADEWATQTAHFLTHRNGDRIRIRGSLPEISERLRGQRLQVSCNGVHLREFPVAFGDFWRSCRCHIRGGRASDRPKPLVGSFERRGPERRSSKAGVLAAEVA
jgi:hypothetical protein